MDEDKIYRDDNYEPNFVIVEEQKPYEKKKKRSGGRKILTVILVIVIGAVSGFGGGLAALHFGIDLLDLPIEQSQINITPQAHVDTAEAVAKKVIPSVVGISTTTEIIRENILGIRRGELVEGVGTGFIVHEDGYILTNSHVIGDGSAKNITVQLTDRREMEGRVLWFDTTLDLAIVKIEATNLTPVELGDSDKVNIGAYAVAIGNPFGLDFDRSVTQGVISGLDRTITVGNNMQQTTMEGLMQTDASINSGNSGGPLLNSKGEVIGINTAKAASGEGLGFAIPINTAKPIIKEVMETGTFKKAYIGIGGADVELYLQYFPQDDFGTETGVYVSKVYEGSPADKAGLRVGDAIVAIDDKEIKTMEQLTRELFSFKPGDIVTIKFYRNGKMMEAELKLGVLEN
ncbi:MAG: PDZ domain-containing protein [Clostridiales bacterium]|nr:PDZ domain-containing protein [Clostridiales bacterium]